MKFSKKIDVKERKRLYSIYIEFKLKKLFKLSFEQFCNSILKYTSETKI